MFRHEIQQPQLPHIQPPMVVLPQNAAVIHQNANMLPVVAPFIPPPPIALTNAPLILRPQNAVIPRPVLQQRMPIVRLPTLNLSLRGATPVVSPSLPPTTQTIEAAVKPKVCLYYIFLPNILL
jgi:hypothetical protein